MTSGAMVIGIRNDTAAHRLTIYRDSTFTNGQDFTVSLLGLKMRFTEWKDSETYNTSQGLPSLAKPRKPQRIHTHIYKIQEKAEGLA